MSCWPAMCIKKTNAGRVYYVANEENVIKSLLFSSLIALALAITPAWGAGEIAQEKPVTAKKHKASQKHKATSKNKTSRTQQVVQISKPATAEPTVAVTPALVQPSINPYLPVAIPLMAGVVVTPPMAPVAVMAPPRPSAPVNPYLQPILFPPFVTTQPPAVVFPAISRTQYGEAVPTTLTYLPNGLAGISTQFKSIVPTQLSSLLSGSDGESHWPISFKTVYPTGEKPLWVLTLKCPTEAAFGIAPPPVKVVHIALTAVMDGINYTGVLPVNLQQVCQ